MGRFHIWTKCIVFALGALDLASAARARQVCAGEARDYSCKIVCRATIRAHVWRSLKIATCGEAYVRLVPTTSLAPVPRGDLQPCSPRPYCAAPFVAPSPLNPPIFVESMEAAPAAATPEAADEPGLTRGTPDEIGDNTGGARRSGTSPIGDATGGARRSGDRPVERAQRSESDPRP